MRDVLKYKKYNEKYRNDHRRERRAYDRKYRRARREEASRLRKKKKDEDRLSVVISDKRYACKKRYRITLEQYEQKILNQKNLCRICFKPMKIPCLDHDHKTGRN